MSGRWLRRATSALVALLTVLVATPATSSGAVDTEPPRFTVSPYWKFDVGSQVWGQPWDATYGWRCEGPFPATLRWKARDNLYVAGYRTYHYLDRTSDPDGEVEKTLWSEGTATRLGIWLDAQRWSYENGFIIEAFDGVGNTTQAMQVQPTAGCADEDGSNHTEPEERGLGPTFSRQLSGAWRTTDCTCYVGLTAVTTKSAGAAVTYELLDAAQPGVALVMSTARRRGAVEIAINDVPTAIIDTRRRYVTHRMVVFSTASFHVGDRLTITNIGTEGRPRIDIDALLYLA